MDPSSQPTLYLHVTNTGPSPCTEDLADKFIELVLRSGGTRIWGSRDCAVQPGARVVTLRPDVPVKRAVEWTGRTSKPGCTGARSYPPAGNYELVASLAGQHSKPVELTLTGS